MASGLCSSEASYSPGFGGGFLFKATSLYCWFSLAISPSRASRSKRKFVAPPAARLIV